MARLFKNIVDRRRWDDVSDKPVAAVARAYKTQSSMRLVAIALLAWFFFAVLSIWFLTDEHRLDRVLLFGLAPPLETFGNPDRLDGAAWSVTALGSPEVVVLFSAAILGCLILAKSFNNALFTLLAIGGGALLGYATKTIFGYFRPHHAPGPQDIMLNTSFPSGHALLATLFFLSIALLLSKEIRNHLLRLYVGVFATSVITLVGWSRVYLGLHWPSDVLAGWAFGVGWTVLAYMFVFRLPSSPAKRWMHQS